MNVGELKEQLKNVPDDYTVIADHKTRVGEAYPLAEGVAVCPERRMAKIKTMTNDVAESK